jgi:hypothetical protein
MNRLTNTQMVLVATIMIVTVALVTAQSVAMVNHDAQAHKKRHHRHHHHHGGQSASASISQSNTQNAACISGSSTYGSCNQNAVNVNTGNAVAANVR